MGEGVLKGAAGRVRNGVAAPTIAPPPAVPGLDDPFPRREGTLHAGSVPLPELARRFGTPLYVYDADHLRDRYRAVAHALAPADPLVAYSVKANGNLALLDRLAREGAGADIVSGGELARARRAGIPAGRIVFSGVGKTRPEMEAALEEGIYGFNVESSGELEVLEEVARAHGSAAPVAVRVNPDIESPTPHAYTRTGHGGSKFGVPADEALALYRRAAEGPHLRVRGIDAHIGSQIVDPRPYRRAIRFLVELAERLAGEGIPLEYLDMGGGFGVRYGDAPAMALDALAPHILEPLEGSELRLVVEPGRYLVAQAGVLLTRVLYLKRSGGRLFVITDSGMTDLLRPSHYGGVHAIEAVESPEGEPERRVDVVGPICETGDFLGLDREMVPPAPGDLLAVRTVGAYGFTMASNYNARPRPAEVLVEGGAVHLVRARETVDDLVRGETIPEP